MKQKKEIPERLFLIRHARSLANQLFDEACAKGEDRYHLPVPDSQCPLVDDGVRQVEALASWLSGLDANKRPSSVLSSTHLRARQTATALVQGLGPELPLSYERKLGERRWGFMQDLTLSGFARLYPAEASRREKLGDFRYRPLEGGESLRDLRRRVETPALEHLALSAGANLAIVTHSQVLLVLRQILEGLSERQTLELEHKPIPNCSVCIYERKGNRLVLSLEYFVA